MKHAQPLGLSRRRVEQLLSKSKSYRSAGDRIEVLSRFFLGRPYTINPLIGSAEKPEVFVTSLDGFDCVTYVETILALSRASTVDDFVERLRKIRYERGQIQWERRNHYMTGWIRNNARSGSVRRLSPRDTAMVVKERVLNIVPGFPPVKTRFEAVPKSEMRKLAPQLQTGDVIFFGSTRAHNDVFHIGFIIRDGNRLRLRHASRSKGAVVEQELDEFLKANRMSGVIIARPR